MRILYFTKEVIPNKKACSIQILNTCSALTEKGIDIYLYVKGYNTKKVFSYYGIDPNTKIKLRIFRNIKVIKYFTLFFITLYHKLFDRELIIITREIRISNLLVTIYKTLHCKFIFEVHDIIFNLLGTSNCSDAYNSKEPKTLRKLKLVEKRIIANADAIICTTNYAKEILQKNLNRGKYIEVIHNGTKIVNGFDLENPVKKEIDIIYIGKLYRRKGIYNLIAAMKYLDDYKLVVIGGYPNEDLIKLKKIANEMQIENNIFFTGYLSPSGIKNYLLRAKVGVVPLLLEENLGGRYFANPLKLLEYMMVKVPIVATNLIPIREIIIDGENGILIDEPDPLILANSIKKLLTDRILASKLAENAYKTVQNFTWEKRAEKYLNTFKNIS